MTESISERSPHDRKVDALIAEFELAAEQGHPLDPEEFLKQHAEYAGELREYFEDAGRMNAAVQPYRPEPDETEPVSGSQAGTLKQGTTVRYFGDYEILEELGSGGMGVVYKARQKKLKRLVALKMIKRGQFASEEDVKRFQAEAQAAAKLDHPGIVRVIEVGLHQGEHYYAMDYVAGGSLSSLYREQPVSARQAAELVKKLAEAMHHAHGQGIVHRDLKPANVLLTTTGAPRITDFGLAKSLPSGDDSTGVTMTETGQVLGTAGYMSPEQAAGKTGMVNTPTDIYSLGAILYALLTSRAPFVGDSPSVTILQVLNNEPVPLRALNPSVPRDLETICLKCLEKDPHKRYGTAQLLADDLGRFLEGRPVIARPISSPARAWRWCRRNAVTSSFIATSALLLLVVVVLTTVGYITQSRLARELRAENARNSQNLYFVGEHAALQEVRNGNSKTALDLLERCPPAYRNWEWHWLKRLCDGYCKDFEIPILGVPPLCRSYSPDGQLLTISWSHVVPGESGRLKTFDAHSGKQNGAYPGVAHAYAPDSRSIAIASTDGTIDLLDIASGKRNSRYQLNPTALYGSYRSDASGNPHPNVFAPCFGPGGQFLGGYEFCSKMTVWRVGSTEPHLCLSLPIDNATWSSSEVRQWWDTIRPEHFFSPDGKYLAFPNSNDATAISIWNIEERSVVRELKGHSENVLAIRYSADGSRLVSVDKSSVARIWDPTTGKEVFQTTATKGCFRISQDGKWIVFVISGGKDRNAELRMQSAIDGTVRWKRNLQVADAEFLRDGSLVVAADGHGWMHVMHAGSGQDLVAFCGGPHERVGDFTGPPSINRLEAAGDRDAVACVKSKADDRLLVLDLSRVLIGDADRNNKDCSFSSDGAFIWSIHNESGHHKVQAWDAASEHKIVDLTVDGYLLSRDGLEFAGKQENTIEIWKLAANRTTNSAKPLRPHFTLATTGKPIAFSTQRRRLITEKVTQTIQKDGDPSNGQALAKEVSVWSFDQLAPLLKFSLRKSTTNAGKPVVSIDPSDGPEFPSNTLSVCCSDDAKYLAAISGNDVHLWDCETGRRGSVLNHDRPVRLTTFASQGAYLATLCPLERYRQRGERNPQLGEFYRQLEELESNDELCLWNPNTGKLLHRFAINAQIKELRFSPTCDRLLCCDRHSIRLWSIPDGQLLYESEVNQLTGRRQFTPDCRHLLSTHFVDFGLYSDYCLTRVADRKSVTLVGSAKCHNLSLSPDGHRLAAMHEDELRIYDTETGTEVFRWSIPSEGNSAHNTHPRFSPDGKEILVRNLRLDSGMRQTPKTK
jgi:serine/threonine protein kinase/WD40 repeat protein